MTNEEVNNVFQVTLCVDVNSMTVKDLEEQVLKKTLNMVAPDVILDGKGTVIISSEEGETSENNPKKLGVSYFCFYRQIVILFLYSRNTNH